MTLVTERVHIAECRHCGQQFYAGRKGTIFCSNSCKQQEWRERQDKA
jgi:hypothetical protein